MSKSKPSTQTQTSTSALDPRIMANLQANIQNAQGAAARLSPFTGQRVAGFNDSQTAAQQGLLGAAQQKLGSGLLGQATQAAQTASTYKPVQIAAPAAQGGPAVTASTATARPDVTTSAVSVDQINGYLNPFTQQVVDTTMADLERQRQIEQTYNAAQATKAKAFGGTGAAVLSGLTNDNFARTGASTAANLRSQGFNTALGAAQTDAARRLQADQGNQSQGNQVGMFNAGQTQAANIFNSGQTQGLNLFNAGQDLTAQQANQSAGISGAGLNLQAGGLLGDLAKQERDFALGDIGLLGVVGDAQQAQSQRELDAALQAWQQGVELTAQQQAMINQAIGLMGNPVLTQSKGTSTGAKEGTLGPIMSAIGTGLQAAAMFSDRRLKADIEPIGTDDKGRRWYCYRYLWERARRVGVMAQEVRESDPHAVIELPSGLLAVNYGAL